MNREDLEKEYEELKAKYGLHKLRIAAWASGAFIAGFILGSWVW